MRRLAMLSILFPLIAAAAGCASPRSGAGGDPAPGAAAGEPGGDRPDLLVVVIIDQFRADYLERFGSQLTHGLARLLKEGAVFTDAHHDHAIPETAPGHATLLSGRFPRSTWIISNAVGVDDPRMPLVQGKGPGASPHRFAGTTLVDWMLARDSASRILSVSRKDAGAILPVGHARQDVYWYDPTGLFTTSRWYRTSLPGWVREFNARGEPYAYVGREWELLLPEEAYPEPDSVDIESVGVSYTFPHRLPPDSARTAAWLIAWPWMDDVTVSFALHGLQALDLGRGGPPDLLVISLSASDAIGHRFGPDSREVHDQVLRLDRLLGRFLDSLFVLRDPSTVAVAFIADHGIGSFPELAVRRGVTDARRVGIGAPLSAVRQRLREAGVDTLAIDAGQGLVFLQPKPFEGAPLSPAELARELATRVRSVPGVMRVDEVSSLERAPESDAIARRWRNLLPPGVPVEQVITLEPHSVWDGVSNARHDSPHDYDTHVPLILHGRWFRPGRDDAFVRTVDLAPTLAQVLGVRPSAPIDGVTLDRVVR